MYLTYEDLAELFPNPEGIKDINIRFHTVSPFANEKQPKGLFIPLLEESGKLQQAIQNGAIAMLWQEGVAIPSYTPNHFPIFFTNDLLKGYKKMLIHYTEKLNSNKETNMDMTKFLFFNKKLLNKDNDTYDIAVIEQNLEQLLAKNELERRG